MLKLIRALIKKILGIESPSTMPLGYKYEFDYLRRKHEED